MFSVSSPYKGIFSSSERVFLILWYPVLDRRDTRHEPILLVDDSDTCHSPTNAKEGLCNNTSDTGSSSHEHVYLHWVTFGKLHVSPPTPLSSRV